LDKACRIFYRKALSQVKIFEITNTPPLSQTKLELAIGLSVPMMHGFTMALIKERKIYSSLPRFGTGENTTTSPAQQQRNSLACFQI